MTDTKINRPTTSGVTMLEIIFSIAIFSLVAVAAAEHIGLSWSFTAKNKDRIFAYRKAQSMLSELQAFVDRGDAEAASDLDQFDDGVVFNTVLTITEVGGKAVDPTHPASQNSTTEGGRWRWTRQVSVRPFPGEQSRDVRFVTVRIFRTSKDGRRARLAEMSSVIRTVGTSYPTTQVYDVYLLAIENIPGWWVYMDSIRPFIEATLTDLEARNPGLEFRAHWITKSGFGRDPYYSPYTNETTSSTDTIPSTYFYPGRMPSGSSSSRYYVADGMQGMKSQDGTLTNHYSDNPFPYTLADQFNHAMRLPDAMRLFQQRVAAGLEDPLNPPWQILLEDMSSHPDKYHNAIFVNLHGELLPMPALRNYSDPAKSPSAPGVRVVSHTEQLRYTSQTGGNDVRLRVYAYAEAEASTTLTTVDTISVRLGGLALPDQATLLSQLTDPDPSRRPVLVEKYEAIKVAPNKRAYQRLRTTPGAIPGLPTDPLYVESATIDNGDLVLKLRNTPLSCPVVEDGSGLSGAWRLYGNQYVPCPLGMNFAHDLTFTGNAPKNTARWVVTLRRAPAGGVSSYLPAAGSGNRLLEIETSIGDTAGNRYPRIAGFTPPDLLWNPDWSGLATVDILNPNTWESGFEWAPETLPANRWPTTTPSYLQDPTNSSRTYAYWTASADDVPVTERYQYNGDPRHCPYQDLQDGGANFPNGYNWFFDDMNGGGTNMQAAWGFATGRLRDGWRGRVDFDVARYMQTLRRAIARAETLYTTLTGFSYYYVGIGNEIGYDSANGYSNSIPVDGRPYGTTGDIHVDSISFNGDAAYRHVKYVRSTAANYWWSKTWLGELYPDSAFATWRSTGNLPAGTGSGSFYRTPRNNVTRLLPTGTRLVRSTRLSGAEGCVSLFNIGTNTATFHHQYRSGQLGALTTVGAEISQNYNFSLPTKTKISRPFGIDVSGDGGLSPEFGFTTDYPRYSAALVRSYYGHDSAPSIGSALIELKTPAADRSGYIVVNGIDRTIESGSAFIAKYSLLTLIHSLFEAGDGGLTRPVARLPRTVILAPTASVELIDPTSLTIQWTTAWRRWDGKPYSASSGTNTLETETRLRYVLMYSKDNGKTWNHMLDDSVATPGVRPGATLILLDQGTGQEVHTWPTPSAKFPVGSYLIRIDTYRDNESLHYAHHTEKIYIDRG